MKTNLFKSLFFTLVLFFVVSTTFGFQSGDNSLLWKISGNGLQEESYLFGTIHIICKSKFKMDDRIENAFKNTDKLALEINMADPDLMSEMQQLSMNPGMKNIQDEFSEEDAASIDDFLKDNYGVGLAQLGILKPFVLSSMIMVKKLPCDEQSSYEIFFMERAKEQEKEIAGLETVAFQMGIFDQIPQKSLIDELAKMINEPDGMEEFDDMVAAYQNEDINALYTLITKNEMFSEYGDILLKERNENWIPVIETIIREESTFIAVGAGHLGSESGVIELLRKAGYTIEPVF